MKQVRRNVFETNSSSTHSITMCTKDEWDKLNKRELLITKEEDIITIEEAKEILKENQKKYDLYGGIDFDSMSDSDFILFIEDDDNDVDLYDLTTMEKLIDYRSDYLEYYEKTYKTSSGEEVIAFGFFGYDG